MELGSHRRRRPKVLGRSGRRGVTGEDHDATTWWAAVLISGDVDDEVRCQWRVSDRLGQGAAWRQRETGGGRPSRRWSSLASLPLARLGKIWSRNDTRRLASSNAHSVDAFSGAQCRVPMPCGTARLTAPVCHGPTARATFCMRHWPCFAARSRSGPSQRSSSPKSPLCANIPTGFHIPPQTWMPWATCSRTDGSFLYRSRA